MLYNNSAKIQTADKAAIGSWGSRESLNDVKSTPLQPSSFKFNITLSGLNYQHYYLHIYSFFRHQQSYQIRAAQGLNLQSTSCQTIIAWVPITGIFETYHICATRNDAIDWGFRILGLFDALAAPRCAHCYSPIPVL